MARKPNYKFERMERDRAKAAKKEARQKAKQEKTDQRKAAALAGEEYVGGPPLDDFPDDTADSGDSGDSGDSDDSGQAED